MPGIGRNRSRMWAGPNTFQGGGWDPWFDRNKAKSPVTYSYSWPNQSEFELISDIRGNKTGLNPVLHQHFRIFVRNGFWYGSSYQFYTHGYAIRNSHQQGPWDQVLLPLPSAFIADRYRDALQKWETSFPESLSLANFLYELKDLKNLIPRIKGMKTLPNGFLSYEFGWKPLISDLKKLSKVIKDTIKRLEFLRSVNNKWIQSHYAKEYFTPPFDRIGPFISEVPHVGMGDRNVEVYHGKITISAYTKIRVQGLDSDIAFLRAFILALGLDNPGKIVWNAIPYSFVVDWFVKLDDYQKPLFKVFPVQLEVRHCTWSYKERGSIVESKLLNNPGSNTSTRRDLGAIAFRRYERGVRIPIEPGSLQFTSLTSKQQWLLAALISQRMKF